MNKIDDKYTFYRANKDNNENIISLGNDRYYITTKDVIADINNPNNNHEYTIKDKKINIPTSISIYKKKYLRTDGDVTKKNNLECLDTFLEEKLDEIKILSKLEKRIQSFKDSQSG